MLAVLEILTDPEFQKKNPELIRYLRQNTENYADKAY